MSKLIWLRVCLLAMVGLAAQDAAAQGVVGTFRWRFAPYCNVVTLTVVQYGASFTASGFDDGCGSTASVATGAFYAGAGGISGSVSLIGTNGAAVANRIVLSPSLSGTWSDNFGNSGAFTFSPAAAPGSPRPTIEPQDLWAYVISNAGLHASSGGIEVTHPGTGNYCVVIAKRYAHKAAQVTLADPGGIKIVSVGTGHGSQCNPLYTDEEDVIPVYVRTVAGVAIDGNFTIVIPAR